MTQREFMHDKKMYNFMKAANIHDLYHKFREKGVLNDQLWDLTDDFLTDNLKLTGVEKLRYDTANAMQYKGIKRIDSINCSVR